MNQKSPVVCVFILLSVAHVRAIQYEWTMLPSEVTAVGGLNNSGRILVSTSATSQSVITTWSVTDGFSTRELPGPFAGRFFQAQALSENGAVSGFYDLGHSNLKGLVRIDSSNNTTIYQYSNLRDSAYFYGINELGAAAGAVVDHRVGDETPLSWRADGTSFLIQGSQSNTHVGITNLNNANQLIGFDYGAWAGVRVEHDGSLTQLETLGTHVVVPNGINLHGEVVGVVNDGSVNSIRTVYVWRSNGTLRATFSAENAGPTRINDLGHVFFSSRSSTTGVRRAHVWTPWAGIQNLDGSLATPVPGLSLRGVSGINNSGQVVASGTLNGQTRFALLTPVPEPGTLIALGVGIAAFLRRNAKDRGESKNLPNRLRPDKSA